MGHSHAHHPAVFDEFIESGYEENVSPFLTPHSRRWSNNLPLRAGIFSAFLLLAAFLLSFFSSYTPLSDICVLFVYFIVGTPSLIDAIEDLCELNINIDILMTLAAFSSFFLGSTMEGALLLVLFSISGAMESAVSGQATQSIRELHDLVPTSATVIDEEGHLIKRSVKEIKVGDTVHVRSGEVIPVDGIIIKGQSLINLVHLTGESVPVRKEEGDDVPSGAHTFEGALSIRVTKPASRSTLSKIISLVKEAHEARPQMQRWFDRFSKPYATTIIALTFLFSVTLPFLLGIPLLGHEGSVYRSLAFLIAASPCALIIATPIVYLSSISTCAGQGILLKGGVTLDAIAGCDTIAFDKTGTLTSGELKCVSVDALDGKLHKNLISTAAALEMNAIHPIAHAIIRYAKEQDAPPIELTQFKAHAGNGLEGVTEDGPVYIGRPSFVARYVPSALEEKINAYATQIEATGDMFSVCVINEQAFFFRFSDAIRPQIQQTLTALHTEHNCTLTMLTGDHSTRAASTAQALGIDTFYGELTPKSKLEHVTKLSEKGSLAMVGDGINDAPALARATVGIAMGGVGSTSAIEAASVILLHDNIQQLPWLFKQAKKTQRIIKQNVSLAALAIIGASLPAIMGLVPLWLAVILHEGGTVLVGLNGLRLLRK